MAAAVRPGRINRFDGRGWVPIDEAPAPEPAAPVHEPDPDPAYEPEPVEQPYADRADCADCGKDVAVNKDGSLRKHTCEV